MSRISKELSRKYVFSQSINFVKFNQEVEYYNRRALQSLFVIILRDLDDLKQFSRTTKLYNMSLHQWLVVFMDSADTVFNQHCSTPRSNIFGLVVNTKMLVKCHKDEMIREWYSFDKIGVVVNDYGLWRYGRGLTKLIKGDFYERRSDFKGITLKVSAVKVRIIYKMIFKEI